MRATAEAQPNIALIKYWGKRDESENLPATGSLSITLSSLRTRMTVDLGTDARTDSLSVNGRAETGMLKRVSACLDHMLGPDRPRASIESDCNFPIAAGLASSAAAFAALVVSTNSAAGLGLDQQALARAAGRASGSAARSLYAGFVELLNDDDKISVKTILPAADWPLEVIVAITARTEKPLSSGEAMRRSQLTSPFYPSWVEQQDRELCIARDAVAARDFHALAEISEHNCLKMHSVMWASRPAIVYWNAATINCMETLRRMQKDGVPVFFTIDAGPQIKAVCPPEAADTVYRALQSTAGVVGTMRSSLGAGARVIETAPA